MPAGGNEGSDPSEGSTSQSRSFSLSVVDRTSFFLGLFVALEDTWCCCCSSSTSFFLCPSL